MMFRCHSRRYGAFERGVWLTATIIARRSLRTEMFPTGSFSDAFAGSADVPLRGMPLHPPPSFFSSAAIFSILHRDSRSLWLCHTYARRVPFSLLPGVRAPEALGLRCVPAQGPVGRWVHGQLPAGTFR